MDQVDSTSQMFEGPSRRPQRPGEACEKVHLGQDMVLSGAGQLWEGVQEQPDIAPWWPKP